MCTEKKRGRGYGNCSCKENENIDAEAIARNMVVGRDIMATGILQKAMNAESGHTAVFILADHVVTVGFPEYQNGVQLTA